MLVLQKAQFFLLLQQLNTNGAWKSKADAAIITTNMLIWIKKWYENTEAEIFFTTCDISPVPNSFWLNYQDLWMQKEDNRHISF